MDKCLGKSIQAKGTVSVKPGGGGVPGLWDSTIEEVVSEVKIRADWQQEPWLWPSPGVLRGLGTV